MSSVLSVKGLSKYYTAQAPALSDINLELEPGRIVGLLGPNGSGKTTLIKLIAGLLTPSRGSISVCGHPIGPESKALVSYLPDRSYLRPGWTVEQQLELFQDFYADFDRERAEKMLFALGVDLKARLKTLSKGNQEKVQLVLVMSRRARLYLLDEPIGGVDPATRDYILSTIVGNYAPDSTVLISTHLISDVENVLDDFIFLRGGKILRHGSVEDAREEEGMSLDELFREVFKCLPNY